MKCIPVTLPLQLPPDTTAHLIPLNKTLNTRKDWGFIDIVNNEGVLIQWPDKGRLAADQPAMYAQKCDVTNHGQSNLTELDIPLRIRYGDDLTPTIFHAMISPLDHARTLSFYAVNNCPVRVQIALPNTSIAQLPGELVKREFNLEMDYPPNHIPNFTFGFGFDAARANVFGLGCE